MTSCLFRLLKGLPDRVGLLIFEPDVLGVLELNIQQGTGLNETFVYSGREVWRKPTGRVLNIGDVAGIEIAGFRQFEKRHAYHLYGRTGKLHAGLPFH